MAKYHCHTLNMTMTFTAVCKSRKTTDVRLTCEQLMYNHL